MVECPRLNLGSPGINDSLVLRMNSRIWFREALIYGLIKRAAERFSRPLYDSELDYPGVNISLHEYQLQPF